MTAQKRKIVLYTFDCTGCGYCTKVCGSGVLKLVDNGTCRFVNVADASRCTGCRRCEQRCPNKAISLKPNNIMKEKLKIAGCALGGVALLALGVAVTMWLWNALIPGIMGWTAINYWQSLGLLVLVRLLFGHFGHFGCGGFGGFGHPRMSRREHRHLHEAMRGMSHSEKREFIRRRMRDLCQREQPADDATAQ